MRRILKMKEPVNTLTHFVTFLAAIVGLIFLVMMTKGNTEKLVTMTIYGVSVILLFGASSLYHWVKVSPKIELWLRKLDHIAIYIMIAGSYTPVFYYGLAGGWRWTMLISVWVLAFVGMVLKLWFLHIPRFVSTGFYVSLGWIAVVPFVQLVHQLPAGALIMMGAGGVAYTIGALIYATKKLDFFPNKFGFHEIFHLFISAGGVIHFLMMLFFFVPLH